MPLLLYGAESDLAIFVDLVNRLYRIFRLTKQIVTTPTFWRLEDMIRESLGCLEDDDYYGHGLYAILSEHMKQEGIVISNSKQRF